MSTRKKGDEGEKFVADYLSQLGFITEIHPRTSRPVIGKNGKPIYHNGIPLRISSDNDYFNVFDLYGLRNDYMIFVQVKVRTDGTKDNMSSAQKKIDLLYSYEFPYQKIQVWQLWKEWSQEGRKHKEFKIRIQERRGFSDKFWIADGVKIKKGIWIDIDPIELKN